MVIVFDFSNLAYSSFFSCIREHKIEAENCPIDFRKHIQTFSKRINELLTFFGSYSKYYFALDKTPKHKYKIFADYKKGRKRFDINPKVALLETIEHWECNAIYSNDQEADDAIASFVAHKEPFERVIVVTTDKDLWQICEFPQTLVYNFHQNKFINKTDLFESFKLEEYRHIKLHKTLWGDSSDNVPNLVPRMQKQLLPFIKASDGTLNNFLAVVEANKSKLSARCNELLEENKNKLKINYDLVKLNYDCVCIKEQLKYKPKEEKIEESYQAPLVVDGVEIPF